MTGLYGRGAGPRRGWVTIVGPWGSKAIEAFKDYETYGDACDTLVSRDEFNDDGVLAVRRVLRRFERIGPVLDLVVNGRVIGTTHEHPFFAKGKGWTKAQELRVGDEVRLMGPGWATVEAVVDTGRLERVYNLEIEDDHTYFVGCDEWGFSVWAHNRYDIDATGKVIGDDTLNATVTMEVQQRLRTLGFSAKDAGDLAHLGGAVGVDGRTLVGRLDSMQVGLDIHRTGHAAARQNILDALIPAPTGIPLKPGELAVRPFKDLERLGTFGDELTPHHLPMANYITKRLGVPYGDGISIMMYQPFPARVGDGGRHIRTRDYGNLAKNPALMAETPQQALARSSSDVRGIYQADGLLTPAVDAALTQALQQWRARLPGVF